jgi:heme-degrading monooxygenase HmoA
MNGPISDNYTTLQSPTNTKEVRMFTAMLEVHPIPEPFDAYLGMAKMLRPELEKIDGFIDNNRYASLTREGWLLSLSSLRDEKALVRWRSQETHNKIMQAARDRVFPTIACALARPSAIPTCPRDTSCLSSAWMSPRRAKARQ